MPDREQTNVMLDRGLLAELHAEAEAAGIHYYQYVERILRDRHNGLSPEKQQTLDELRRLMVDSEPRARRFNILLHRLLDKWPAVVVAASAAVIALAFPIGSYALWNEPGRDEVDKVVGMVAGEDAHAAPCHHEARWKRSTPSAPSTASGHRSTNTAAASTAVSASRPLNPKTAGKTPKVRSGTTARTAEPPKRKPRMKPKPVAVHPAAPAAPPPTSTPPMSETPPPAIPSEAPKEHPVHPAHPVHPPHPPEPEKGPKDKS